MQGIFRGAISIHIFAFQDVYVFGGDDGTTDLHALNTGIWNQIINRIAQIVSIIFIQEKRVKKTFMEKEELDRGLRRICSLGEQNRAQ